MASAAPAAPTANKAELLAIADAVAREKLIDKGIVIEAMEDAIQRAARARYGAENDIRAKLDPNTGDLRLVIGIRNQPGVDENRAARQRERIDARIIDERKFVRIIACSGLRSQPLANATDIVL